MTKICIIRHGETDWNKNGKLQGRTDIPLNNIGISQAKQSGEFLSKNNWDYIITSPLKRAKQTASTINLKLNLPVYEMDEFIERSFGKAEGTYIDKNSLNNDIPKQELLSSLNARILKGLNKINNRFEGKRVLLVTHGAVINSLLTNVSDDTIKIGTFNLANACISYIIYTDKWIVKEFNRTDHLIEQHK